MLIPFFNNPNSFYAPATYLPVKLVEACDHSSLIVTSGNEIYVCGDNSVNQLARAANFQVNPVPIPISEMFESATKLDLKNQPIADDNTSNSSSVGVQITHATGLETLFVATSNNKVFGWGMEYQQLARSTRHNSNISNAIPLQRIYEVTIVEKLATLFKLQVALLTTASSAMFILMKQSKNQILNLQKVRKAFQDVTVVFHKY